MIQQNTSTIKTLNLFFSAMLSGQVLFAILAYFLVSKKAIDVQQAGLEEVFTLLVPVLIITGWFVGSFLFRKKIEEAKNTADTTGKLNTYRSAFIIRCAMLEGPVLFAIISYLLTGKLLFILLAAGGILLFTFLKPSTGKVANELQIPESEV